MQEVNLAQVADELYELAPADFRAVRDERANQARAAGDRELSDAIKKLRRPTVSAWLVNQLVRQAPDEIARLIELGESLREAQQTLAADRLRELSAQRRQVVTALTHEAKRLAAQARRPVSDQAEREVEATLEAALADPAAADAVRSGRLTTGLVYAGLGGIEVADAVAVPAALPGRPRERAARTAPRRREAEPRADAAESAPEAAAQRARESAAHALQEASAAAREAAAELGEAERQVAQARERYEEIQRRIEELEQQLEEAQAAETQAARAVREARRGRDVAARAADTAQRRLAQAQAKLDRLN